MINFETQSYTDKILEPINKMQVESRKNNLENLINGTDMLGPAINRDCFFYHEEHDMGAGIELCGYSDDSYNKCLNKGINCRNCLNYISNAEVRGLVLMKLQERVPY